MKRRIHKTFFVTELSPDEIKYLINGWYNTIANAPNYESWGKKRIGSLKAVRKENKTKLYHGEIIRLYQYWSLRDFNDPNERDIKSRLNYFEAIIGKAIARKIYIDVCQRSHEHYLREAKDVPFPPFFGDSDYGD